MSGQHQPFFVEEKIAAIIPGRAVFFLCGVLLGACAVALHKSEPCYQARAERELLSAEVTRLQYENTYLGPFALRGIGLTSERLRATADDLVIARARKEQRARNRNVDWVSER